MKRFSLLCLAVALGLAVSACQKEGAKKATDAKGKETKTAAATGKKEGKATKAEAPKADAKAKKTVKVEAKAAPKAGEAPKAGAAPAPKTDIKFPGGATPAHDQMFTVLEGMAKIFEANGADCDKLAKALGDYGTKHQTKLAELKGMMDKYTPEQKKAAEASMKTKMMAVLPKIMGGAMKCQKNPAFLEAMKKLKVQ